MPQPVPADDVVRLVNNIMDSRRFRTFQIVKVDFAYFPSAYSLHVVFEGKSAEVKIPSELIHDTVLKGDVFLKRKIKRMIKDALGIKHDSDE
jgi:hypothetical protein